MVRKSNKVEDNDEERGLPRWWCICWYDEMSSHIFVKCDLSIFAFLIQPLYLHFSSLVYTYFSSLHKSWVCVSHQSYICQMWLPNPCYYLWLLSVICKNFSFGDIITIYGYYLWYVRTSPLEIERVTY